MYRHNTSFHDAVIFARKILSSFFESLAKRRIPSANWQEAISSSFISQRNVFSSNLSAGFASKGFAKDKKRFSIILHENDCIKTQWLFVTEYDY